MKWGLGLQFMTQCQLMTKHWNEDMLSYDLEHFIVQDDFQHSRHLKH